MIDYIPPIPGLIVAAILWALVFLTRPARSR